MRAQLVSSYVFLLLILTSCGFNSSFYHPDKQPVITPPEASSNYIKVGEKDSIQSLFYERENPIASLFILHGNAGSLASWSEIADLYYQAGYQVFIIDYPGFGNSSGSANHESVIEAAKNATNYFSAIPSVQNTKKIILGYSLGGNLAVKMSHDYPEVFDALLIEGAFDSHKNIAKSTFPRPFRFLPAILVKNEIDGNKLIAKWNKPLLIIHSTEDATCPYKLGVSLYQNAIATNQKELWTIDGPHLGGLSRNFDLYLAKLKGLVDKVDSN